MLRHHDFQAAPKLLSASSLLAVSLLLAPAAVGVGPVAVAEDATFSPARRSEHGEYRHTVQSPFQAGETELVVLTPDDLDRSKRYPVVYVLPVEPRGGRRYGDGLEEVRKHDLQNKHRAIFAAPSFSNWPWYADHPSDAKIQQETHLLRVVVPFVEKTYPAVAEPGGRLLLGFSKSGWGAWSLLLRHPERFGRAAAWDAPLMMETVGRYGSGEVFETQTNFERYRVSELVAKRRGLLQKSPRLILTGYGNFRAQHQQMQALCERLDIPLVYRDGPRRKHDWRSGWVPEAVELLLADDNR